MRRKRTFTAPSPFLIAFLNFAQRRLIPRRRSRSGEPRKHMTVMRSTWIMSALALLVALAFTQTSLAATQVLVDASRDGGDWWFPQGTTVDPNAPHQGKALADYLRSQGL